MNYRGSYRHLLRNAKAAIMAAIEIYNKPSFAYRDECFVILLLNAWELLLKAMLSKNRKSVFYPKKRNQPYRTLAWRDAMAEAESSFPKNIPPLPVRRNLDLLGTYRDNAVHFYNASGFGSLIYALAQTSIVNFKDVLKEVFGVDLADEINWQLLPLGLKPPVDVIQYISGHSGSIAKKDAAVRQFISEVAAATKEIQDAGSDTGRLLTVFTVKLESTKKIQKADIVVGVQKAVPGEGPLVITRPADPNITHPLRQKDLVQKVGSLNGKELTSYVFQAIAWKYGFKREAQYCWQAKEGILTRYSHDLIAWMQRLSAKQVEDACSDYRRHLAGSQRGRSTR